MKNHFNLFCLATAIGISTLACRGSVDSGTAGTMPSTDSVKTNRNDMHLDTGERKDNDSAKLKDTSSAR